MKFWCRFKDIRYTVEPADYEYDGSGRHRRLVPGLAAVFTPMGTQGSMFDSEQAQQRLGWTDKQREQVEEYLVGHVDFQRSDIRLLDNLNMSAPAKITCAFMVVDAAGVHMCGSDVTPGEKHCARHVGDLDAREAQVSPPVSTETTEPVPAGRMW